MRYQAVPENIKKAKNYAYVMVEEQSDVNENSANERAGDGHVGVLVGVDRLVVHRQVDGDVPARFNSLC